ncbi:FMN-binding negative transcriptional regulator [Pendulispora albinea]|uniref:FMN-binding negative transcriptional regulator n=1 Tax=Pendulispora albinea TaxID=2741071 RepID=A0ABZ2LUI7_9BACT
MYLPASFRENRLPVLHDTIARMGFATLVTSGPDGLVATHLPMYVEPAEGPMGTLYGHVARANPQWKELAGSGEALVTFVGPDAYVSPSYYPSKPIAGKVVPTWNYVAVHAYGKAEAIEEPAPLLEIVTRLTDAHEAGRAERWSVSDAPESYVQGLLRAIVGIRIPISRIEGKWKLSQNRSPEDAAGVIAGLSLSEHGNERATAEAMKALGTPADPAGTVRR